MIISNLGDNYSSKSVKAKVEFYEDTTLVTTCTCSDVLSHFTMSREGELGKFFGFGICHKLDISLIDLEKILRLYEGYTVKVALGDGTTWDEPYPTLDVTSIKVDKKSGDISVIAYDPLNRASDLTYDDLGVTAPYTIKTLAEACGTALGVSVVGLDTAFDLYYAEGGNYGGDESVRAILNHIAEATQTIYYINNENQLVFKRLTTDSVADYHRKDYYEFETGTPKTLKSICNATELGDNLIHEDTTIEDGVTQYVRDNPLWELRDDLATLLTSAVDRICGLELHQYDLDWSGDYRLEIGDCITVHYDDDTTKVHIINDVLSYGGAMDEESSWEWTYNDSETISNPTTLGEKINQTVARVDKANQQIELVVGTTTENTERINQLQITNTEISASVSAVESKASASIDSLEESVQLLTNEVNLRISEDDLSIAISSTLANGVDKLVTATKRYTFDDTGLNIGSSDSPLSTVVSEDGMRIHNSEKEVLVADNTGVIAEDLHATTYLIIGDNSRLEDWQDNYTACFWIGG